MVLKIISMILCALWIMIFFIFTSLNAKDKNCKIIKRIVVIFGLFVYLFVMTTIFIEHGRVHFIIKRLFCWIITWIWTWIIFLFCFDIVVNGNTFVTEDGNMWRMKNINIEKGKKYKLTFDNHDTEIITDDEIVDFIKLNEKVD